MKLEHKVQVGASIEAVRKFLEDVPAVARCIPGIEDVQVIDDNVYSGRARVKVGPIGFSISGQAKLNRGPDGAWRLEGEGRDGRVGAGVKAELEAQVTEVAPEKTDLHLLANIQFSGRLAELGQPLIKRKADSMVKDFAANFQKAMASA